MALAALTTLERDEAAISGALGVLKQRLGERLQTGQAVREQHAHTTSYIPLQAPDAVAFAESVEDVQEVVRVCAQYRVPVIPFGTGTSLEGHVNAPGGGVCLDLSRMDRVLQVNAEDLDCTVEAGVTRSTLNSYLRDTGLFFPIDPGADASLGGMAATRASGTNAVRYGTMRDNVVSLTAVMADGCVVKTGNRARKSSAGYDLTRLLIGSEGTLGIITSLTLRLQGIPQAIAGGVCPFPDVESACQAVIATIQMGVPVARIELLNAPAMGALNSYSGLSYPDSPCLFLEFHGSDSGVKEQSETFGQVADEFGGGPFQWTSIAEERMRLWKARHEFFWAGLSLRPGARAVTTDVCVPISRLSDCIRETEADIERHGLVAPIVGHVGDGNFHVQVLVDPEDQAEIATGEAFVARLNQRAIDMEGTCSGEHGIGQGKMEFLGLEAGVALDYMKAIKQALDPLGILNPGKQVGEGRALARLD